MKNYKTPIKIFSFILTVSLLYYLPLYAEIEPLELPAGSLSPDIPGAQSIMDEAISRSSGATGPIDSYDYSGSEGLAFDEALGAVEYSTSSEFGYYDPWSSNAVDTLPAYGDLVSELKVEMEDEVFDTGGGLRSISNDETAAELLKDIGIKY